MRKRELARIVWAAVGGSLAALCLSAAVASADDGYDFGPYDFTAMPSLEDPTTAAGNILDSQDDYVGQMFAASNASGTDLGDITGTLKVADDVFGFTNNYLDVTTGDAAVPTGSLFDVMNFGGGGEAIFTDVSGLESLDYVSPFGNIDVPSSFLDLFPPDTFIPAVALFF